MNIYGLIVAGGVGHRMGSDIPKQFLKVRHKTIISYTTSVFLEHPKMEKVIILVPQDWIEYAEDLFLQDFGPQEKLVVVAGGELRNDTIMNGIKYIKENLPFDKDTIIVSHDAVRPFITAEIIDRNIEALSDYVACDTVVAATDTIVESTNHKTITDVPNRANLYQGQTPQSFKMQKFEDLYNSLTEEEKAILTDAAKVFVIKGEEVALVEGSTSNIKITHPSDLDIANSILGRRKG